MNEINPEMLKALKGLEASGCRITGGKLKTEYDAKKGDSHTPESADSLRELIEQHLIAYGCKDCGGGGTDEQNEVCTHCKGLGIVDFETKYIVEKLQALITAAIRASNKTLLERLKSKQRTTYMYLQPDTPAVRVSDIDAELARLDQEGADNG